ncbi:MAG: hypothetical protein WEC16_01450 [Anaerolineales bacterium]
MPNQGVKTAIYTFVAYAVIAIILGFSWCLGVTDLSKVFSLAQVVVELILVPIIIFGLLWTATEVRKAQETSDLSLIFRYDDIKTTVLENWEYPSSAYFYTPSIRIVNDGVSPSINHKLIVEIPAGLRIVHEFDAQNNGQILELLIRSEEVGGVIYPEDEVEIGRFKIDANTMRPKEALTFKYRIYSDRQSKKTGELIINFIQ